MRVRISYTARAVGDASCSLAFPIDSVGKHGSQQLAEERGTRVCRGATHAGQFLL